jgi:hypothetical protein
MASREEQLHEHNNGDHPYPAPGAPQVLHVGTMETMAVGDTHIGIESAPHSGMSGRVS